MVAGDRHPPAGRELDQADVAVLWWLSDHAITNTDCRERLRRGWGLCPRHTWAFFVLECESRRQPLGTAVWCLDLLDRAVTTWPHSWITLAARRRVFAG